MLSHEGLHSGFWACAGPGRLASSQSKATVALPQSSHSQQGAFALYLQDLRPLRLSGDAPSSSQHDLLGSPKIHQDTLSGAPLIAPGSSSGTAMVAEPLQDLAGGRSGLDHEPGR